MRLDKFIGHNSSLSRTQIHVAIKQGAVLVNKKVVSKTNTHIETNDEISVNGELITARQPLYLKCYKPIGYVSATTDSEHPTLLDLVSIPFKHELQIVGRLDKDTTGLVLLTNDGQWNHNVTSPKHNHTKTYLVSTADEISASTADLFLEGLLLKGETKKTLPAQLTLINSRQARLQLTEGKYHQVKRMFAAVGNHVVALHRERIGDIFLDDDLQPGDFRALTQTEIMSFERV